MPVFTRAVAVISLVLVSLVAPNVIASADDDFPRKPFVMQADEYKQCAAVGPWMSVVKKYQIVGVACDSNQLNQRWTYDSDRWHIVSWDPHHFGMCITADGGQLMLEKCDKSLLFGKEFQQWTVQVMTGGDGDFRCVVTAGKRFISPNRDNFWNVEVNEGPVVFPHSKDVISFIPLWT
ncbi:hypothetical protein [Actinokineospora globicatena]|uniref:Ricin B lectin domain-containing protein n=1 Tax=Actinokineospora globicatena TaxID=103729 RepID=A0A9W6V525_9PSEU|nr:hypothetical protein [Actinokineospora globicatena]GLW89870.1 hypothetical protein Aglo03_06860 [Actinokineospora globicatena]